MKTIRGASFFLLMSLVGTTIGRAQTADEVVGKYLQAVGGKDVIAATKSVVITCSTEVNGMDAPTTSTIVAGKAYKLELDFGGTKVVQCVTDHSGWGVNPMAGQATATTMSDADVKTAQTRLMIVPLADYTANGGKIELVGKDTAAFKVKYTNNLGFNSTYYINQKTWLIDKADVHIPVRGQQVDATMVFTDYRKIDNGLLMPYKVEQDLPQVTLNVTVSKVEVNKEIDPKIFEMPK